MNNHLWLLPTVNVAREGSDAVLFDSKRQVRLPGLADDVARLVSRLDGQSGEELLKSAPGRELARLLDEHGWLVRLSESLSSDRIAQVRTRQLSYFSHLTTNAPERAFDELGNARVLVIGTGGIGSAVAFHLAASGVRNLILNDPDVVETSNLNRQILFTKRDVGRKKVEVLADAIRARFDAIDIATTTVNEQPDEIAEMIARVDLTLLCGERNTIHDRPDVLADRPIVPAGYFGCEAVVGPVVSPAHGTARWEELVGGPVVKGRIALERDAIERRNKWNSSGATINGVAGALLAEVAVRLLAPSLGGPILLMTCRCLDMRTFSTRDVHLNGS